MLNPLGNPSLPYHLAFDICGVEANRSGGDIVVLASNPFYAREIIKRLHQKTCLYPLGDWTAKGDESLKRLSPEINWDLLTIHDSNQKSKKSQLIIWAEPEDNEIDLPHRHIKDSLHSSGRVIIITSNWLRFVLPEWKDKAYSAMGQPLGIRRTRRLTTKWGFSTISTFNVLGLECAAQGLLARAFSLSGRMDLVDRYLSKWRTNLLSSANFWPSSLSILTLSEKDI